MPCRTDYTFDEKSSYVEIAKYNKLQKEADNVTRLLCSVMQVLNRNDHSLTTIKEFDSIEGLAEWWDHHQEVDRKRIEKEVEQAEKSLVGLSKEARELLIQKLKG